MSNRLEHQTMKSIFGARNRALRGHSRKQTQILMTTLAYGSKVCRRFNR